MVRRLSASKEHGKGRENLRVARNLLARLYRAEDRLTGLDGNAAMEVGRGRVLMEDVVGYLENAERTLRGRTKEEEGG